MPANKCAAPGCPPAEKRVWAVPGSRKSGEKGVAGSCPKEVV